MRRVTRKDQIEAYREQQAHNLKALIIVAADDKHEAHLATKTKGKTFFP